ncbi:hypothetical protein R84B8_02903 [Treponema sp. R8-4-B8]
MKHILALIYIFSFAVSAFSIPLEGLTDRASQLHSLEQGRIIKAQLKNPAPELLPNHNYLRQYITGVMNQLNPNMLIEALYLYIKPSHLKTDSSDWDERQKVKVYNQITAISTLTGIQYYSYSRGAMRTFYDYSSIIDSPTSKKPLSDPVFSQIPATLTVFARQKDLTFGDNIYRYDYENNRDSVFFTQENITSLNYGIIPVIGKGNLRSVMAVFDCGDTILIYAASMAKAAYLPGFSDKITASFNNRAQAVINWFSGRLDKEL